MVTFALPAAAGSDRIVAVGDVHGNFDGLTAILQEAGLIDEKLRWAGGDATYIQMGDIYDRGLLVRESLDLIMRLQDEARAAGGRVECILGNHETMNLMGFYRDANPDVYASFADAKSEKRRRKLWNAVKRYRDLFGRPIDDAAEEAWKTEHPLGWIEYVESLLPKGRYGRWLRERPVAVLMGDTLFIHGGVCPQVAGMSVDEINDTVADELRVYDRVRLYLVGKSIVPPTAGLEEVVQGVRAVLFEAEKEDSTDLVRRHADQVRELADIDSWLIMSPEGPLWFRGAVRWDETERGAEMKALINGAGARTMVVAHTPDKEGMIRTRFDGSVFLIDTGMLSTYYGGGRASALEIADGVFTAFYLGGEREVLRGGEVLDKAAELVPSFDTPAETTAVAR
ncbi:MAG: metallophosphoesterase [Thermoanaerobaculales bacterium]|nr:metallophosphoesterase [Thermoanaerobaculales bacterium]